MYTMDEGVLLCVFVVFLRPKFPLFFVVKASSLSLADLFTTCCSSVALQVSFLSLFFFTQQQQQQQQQQTCFLKCCFDRLLLLLRALVVVAVVVLEEEDTNTNTNTKNKSDKNAKFIKPTTTTGENGIVFVFRFSASRVP